MNKSLICFASIAALGMTSMAPSFADDEVPPPAAKVNTGQVTFLGTILANTCEVDMASQTREVKLPKLSTASLKDADSNGGSVMFDIDVIKCDDGINSVAAHFETDNIDGKTRGATNIAPDGAKNVVVQLLDSDGITKVDLGASGKMMPVTDKGAVDGTRGTTLFYAGQYLSKGDATSGQVKAEVRFTLAYE